MSPSFKTWTNLFDYSAKDLIDNKICENYCAFRLKYLPQKKYKTKKVGKNPDPF